MLKRVCAALLVLACLPVQARAASPGGLTHHSYTAPGGLTRSYDLYVPAGLRPGRPVVVFLHGCNETASQGMQASHWNAEADKRGFAVAYPEQVVAQTSSAPAADGNGIGCWNWFLPEHQARGAGEPQVLAGIAQEATRLTRGDRRRVYVEGVSAGGAMSVILGATYPDVFAGIGSIAGCAYSTCGDGSGALTAEAMGPRARQVPLFVENGTADVLNPVGQSTNLVQSWLGADDLVDDGAPNGSVDRQPATNETTLPKGTPQPGSGDPCLHNNSFGCLGGVAGLSDYPVTVQTWAAGVELWVVHGLAHAHPDAPGGGPYTDPLGPDITAASWTFFARHHL